MGNILINQSDEAVKALLNSIDRIRCHISTLREKAKKPTLNNESYLTDKELQKRLRVSRRCLQDWRNKNIIPYYYIGGKILYRENDVQKLLESHRFNAKKR